MTKQSIDQMQLPAPDAASGLLDSLYAERFFGKMAEYGHVPRTKEAAEAMLHDSLLLDQIPEEKQAAADPYLAVHEKLAAHMQQQAPVATDRETVKLAAALAGNADLYKAVLSVRAAEAVS